MVLWDSHPLSLGATPKQVFIDGIPQIEKPFTVHKSQKLQTPPHTPDWSQEIKDAIKYQGLPPIVPHSGEAGGVLFTNIGHVWDLQGSGSSTKVTKFDSASGSNARGTAYFYGGKLVCSSFAFGGLNSPCPSRFQNEVMVVDLKGGSLAPGLISFGGNLGNIEIEQEPSTNDGVVDGTGPLIEAIDGISFQGRNELYVSANSSTFFVSHSRIHSID